MIHTLLVAAAVAALPFLLLTIAREVVEAYRIAFGA